ncbi:MAG: M20/M25/M40 family metallo-hydrolase [Anaerolineales bacterium]|nr:M20/M25/M40 family metallo-hydrolase [Anaerolineales bacterium]
MPTLAERVVELAGAIQQIPAPTFQELQRAQFVRDRLAILGLSDVSLDADGNVFARRPGQGASRPVLVTAHTDTVFPAETPLTLTRAGERLNGPGIGDNSLGVAGLFGLIWALEGERLPGDLWLAANICEEGLGDLRGMRRVMERLGETVQATVVLEGMTLGYIYHGGIGVRRLRFTARAEGGHSWLNFGRPSAIHHLVQLAAELTRLSVPAAPRTTFNIGTLAGGTSINTIAREATLDLDLRSEDPAALAALVKQVEALADAQRRQGVLLEMTVIGDRPSGSIPREHPLVQTAARALQDVGYSAKFDTGSTDANIPLSQGRPCVCIGLTHGGNAHRPDEFIETAPVAKGLQALAATVRGAFRP